MISQPQLLAILWLAGEDLPAWYDSARLSTLQALERRGLVGWTTDGPRTYWVKPSGGSLDHWYPYLTDAGYAVAREGSG